MRIYDIIAKKRDGYDLSDEEIAFFVRELTNGSIKDYQATALLMAIYIQGMSDREMITLTKEMAISGDTLDLSELGITADKHSTGGVGDKTTLIVTPIVASLGINVAKMSGRGLGHTGGTVDKLESIDGFKVSLSPEDFAEFCKCTNRNLCHNYSTISAIVIVKTRSFPASSWFASILTISSSIFVMVTGICMPSPS